MSTLVLQLRHINNLEKVSVVVYVSAIHLPIMNLYIDVSRTGWSSSLLQKKTILYDWHLMVQPHRPSPYTYPLVYIHLPNHSLNTSIVIQPEISIRMGCLAFLFMGGWICIYTSFIWFMPGVCHNNAQGIYHWSGIARCVGVGLVFGPLIDSFTQLC